MIRKILTVITVICLNGCVLVPIPVPAGLDEEYSERVISGEGPNKILVIPVEGIITDQETASLFGPTEESTVASIKQQLKKASKDKSIKAVVLKINSPGGTVTGSDIIYHELKQFKKEKNIPVVAGFMDLAASGGYYIAMASDRVYAHPTTITGSIGVILGIINVKEGLDELGIKDYSITSGENKSIGSATQEFKEEQKQILQSIVDDLYRRFVEVVKNGRGSKLKGSMKSIADGKIYTAKQAVANGLVDDILYFDEMVEKTKELNPVLKSGDAKVVVYSKKSTKIENIYQANGQTAASNMNLGILGRLFVESYPQFLYLWRP